MKNAMKKLMAFALVAVMLIGALPFAAFATESSELDPGTIPYAVYVDGTKVGDGTIPTDGNLTVLGLLGEVYPQYRNFNIVSAKVNYVEANGGDPIPAGQYVEFQLETPAPVVPDPVYRKVILEIEGKSGVAEYQVEDGDTVTLSESLLNSKGLNLSLDHHIVNWHDHINPTFPISNGSSITVTQDIRFTAVQAPNTNSQPDNEPGDEEDNNTRIWVDVILNEKTSGFVAGDYHTCYLSNGKVSQADRDAIAGKIVGKNIVAWKAEGYGQENTLLNFDFSDLTQPINVYPVFGSTNSGSTGSTGGSTNTDSDETPEYAWAYIYVGNDNTATKIYRNSSAFSIAGAVDKFDDEMTSKHYAFDYYTVDGGQTHYTNDTNVIEVGHTAHIRVKVTESKLNHNKVYLQIFMNNDFDVPAKTINVTTMATENGLYREGNVRDLILESFSAKNSNGINIDGMYPSTGSWVAKFLEDNKVKNVSSDEIIEMKEDDYVVFNIMVTNAKLKSSSTADSTNPKTADNIYAVVTIMTASAAALAVAFYLNKKRAF